MLPAPARLRHRADFSATVRRGHRGRSPLLLVHVDAGLPPTETNRTTTGRTTTAPRVGFVVSQTVGAAVVRNRVRRRLRHLMADRLADLPAGARVVVRALPPAASARSSVLAGALDDALARALSGALTSPARPMAAR